MIDRRGQPLAVADKRGDIAKLDPGCWKIRDGADQRLDIGRSQSLRRAGVMGAQICFFASHASIVANNRNPSTAQPVCLRFTSVGSAVQVRKAATSFDIWSTVGCVPSAQATGRSARGGAMARSKLGK